MWFLRGQTMQDITPLETLNTMLSAGADCLTCKVEESTGGCMLAYLLVASPTSDFTNVQHVL
jgi:hypothetical protein